MTATDASLAALSPGAVLRQRFGGWIEPSAHLWGFGGLHGGLALALLTAALQEHAGDAPLRGVAGRFHRTIRDRFTLEAAPVHAGRSLTTVSGRVASDRGAHLDASATFGPATAPAPAAPAAPAAPSWPVVAPTPPAAPPPESCDLFTIPTEFAPIGDRFEIRPVGPNRPYAGGSEPELTAWVRLVEDDEPPDGLRLIFLMDALAPSFAAVLSDLRPIPTVELSVRPTDAVVGGRGAGAGTGADAGSGVEAASPWVLLHARTRAAGAGGWIDEQIDAWGLDGAHLGSADQLRLLR